jgi:ArsR family transcriptional regulator, virulence genes transcriptional regulator
MKLFMVVCFYWSLNHHVFNGNFHNCFSLDYYLIISYFVYRTIFKYLIRHVWRISFMEPNVKSKIKECEKVIPFLRMVSNVTRLRILCILSEGERRVGEIQEMLGAKQSYISQQLKQLRVNGYLESRREGTQIYYKLVDPKFIKIMKAFKDTF